jgi:hypothetical protein
VQCVDKPDVDGRDKPGHDDWRIIGHAAGLR